MTCMGEEQNAITLDERVMEICKKLDGQEGCMDGYACQEGLLYYKERVYVPNTLGLREEIMNHFHDSMEMDGTLCGQG